MCMVSLNSPPTKPLLTPIIVLPNTHLHSLTGESGASLGSMNPDPTLRALGLPLDGEENDTYDSVVQRIQGAVAQLDSATLDELMNEQHRQAGTIARTSDEFFASEHGQKNGKIGLYESSKDPGSSQPAAWWPENPSFPSSPKKPLAGLKVVDLARVIAGPAITRSLAEMGASVMRVTSPNVTDMSVLHQDLNWGKWNCALDLKNDADKEKLRALIREADVVVDAYRPGVMERLGFGRRAIFDLVKDRSYGIVLVRENCYGWHGPWSHRSGWQQISDAVSYDETPEYLLALESGLLGWQRRLRLSLSHSAPVFRWRTVELWERMRR